MKDAAARLAADLADPGDLRWFHAPGRVNLIGDHTDYNEGFVLPMAIDRSCVVAARPASRITVRSLDAHGLLEVAAEGSADPRAVEPDWGRYVAAVASELERIGRPAQGIDATLASDVPLGSGLSSSAALEVAIAIALADVAGFETTPLALAQACRRAEEAATGVPCGIMDQLASVAGTEDAALLIDCRSLEVTPVPLPVTLSVVVVHSGVARTLAGSEYAARRQACERLAARLGLPALRDASLRQVEGEPLGRHVFTENRRVLEVVRLLSDGDVEKVGALLTASHASLRDDFRVSTAELDVLVEELVSAGALGARLTGAGFGGCAVALCERSRAQEIAARATAAYRARTGRAPTAFVCCAVAGAGPIASEGGTLAR